VNAAQTNSAEIVVRVRLFADLRRFLPKGEDGPRAYTLPSTATVTDLLDLIGIGPNEEITAGVNGELAQSDTILHDRDELILFSPMEGG
jgi:sulfur carrier protein ThiS